MPVEIRELQITTVISDIASQAAHNVSSEVNNSKNVDSIIAQCVEQVLSILKQKEER